MINEVINNNLSEFVNYITENSIEIISNKITKSKAKYYGSVCDLISEIGIK